MSDSVNNPKHYTSHPSGVECIEIAEMYRKVGYNHSAGFVNLEHEVLTSYSQEEIDLSKFLKEGLY